MRHEMALPKALNDALVHIWKLLLSVIRTELRQDKKLTAHRTVQIRGYNSNKPKDRESLGC